MNLKAQRINLFKIHELNRPQYDDPILLESMKTIRNIYEIRKRINAAKETINNQGDYFIAATLGIIN